MVFPDGSMIIPKGSDYLNFGPFLDVQDFDQALDASQFDQDKHLMHSRGWAKGAIARQFQPLTRCVSRPSRPSVV
jgi:hypothetical protein